MNFKPKMWLRSKFLQKRLACLCTFMPHVVWQPWIQRLVAVEASFKEVFCKKGHPVESSWYLHLFCDFPYQIKLAKQALKDKFLYFRGFISDAFKLENKALTVKATWNITSICVTVFFFLLSGGLMPFKCLEMDLYWLFFWIAPNSTMYGIEATEKLLKRM